MTATAAHLEPARSREELRLVEVASGLLLLLDAHRLTGRLPLEIQASRLRHAVKLAVQAEAARTAALPAAPPPAVAGRDQAAALRAWIAARSAGCICCASATRPPAPTGPLWARAVGVSTPATTGGSPRVQDY